MSRKMTSRMTVCYSDFYIISPFLLTLFCLTLSVTQERQFAALEILGVFVDVHLSRDIVVF